LSGAFAGTSAGETALSKGGDKWESFKGKGESLNGRKTKGRGISQRGIENTMEGSKVFRTDKKRIVTNETLETDVSAPAPLNLPFGQLFFGYKVVPYVKPSGSGSSSGEGSSEPPAPASGSGSASTTTPQAFTGTGNSLTGRSNGPASLGSSAKGKGKEKETASSSEVSKDTEARWGKGNRLTGGPPLRKTTTASSRRTTGDGPVGAGGARAPRLNNQSTGVAPPQRKRSPTPDWGVDDDDDVIYVDSD